MQFQLTELSASLLIQFLLVIYAIIVVNVTVFEVRHTLIFDGFFYIICFGSIFGYIMYIKTLSIAVITLFDRYFLISYKKQKRG
jgi:uncharacterized protein YebE (UPF0316 family)